VLDVACGAGLALEVARLRGADCSGIDASPRLIAIAQDRHPGLSTSASVTCSPDAIGQIFRVLVPGGRVGLTCGDTSRNPPVRGRWPR